MSDDGHVNQSFCSNHFHNIYMYQIIKSHTLNLQNFICQLYLKKAEGGKEIVRKQLLSE